MSFSDVLLQGLAPDGGLYLPESWPQLHLEKLKNLVKKEKSYQALASEIIWPFMAGMIKRADLDELVERSYASFNSEEIVPIKRIDDSIWLAELFHGPTLAFKDIALQLVGQLFDYRLAKSSERITIVGATSGDTGSAAIEACRDRDAMDIVILHPHGKTSEIQRRQMTTVASSNVHNIAIDGNFDDCQNLVKAMFLDVEFSEKIKMSGVNSINWARVMAQIVYYWWTSINVADGEAVEFCVPSGNFGNVFAGFGAHQTGLPISRFIVASNSNNVLDRFFRTGSMEARTVSPTLSPSMDIQISSNFERLLFEVLDRNGEKVNLLLRQFRESGLFTIDTRTLDDFKEKWTSACVNDHKTLETIAYIYQETGELIDPHTAVGVTAAIEKQDERSCPVICLATAHPSKFPEAVQVATGIQAELPTNLEGLLEKEENFTVIQNDLNAVQEFILSKIID